VDLGEVGVQVAAYLGDKLIVDDWIGWADPDRTVPVDGSTMFPVFSVSKALVATAVQVQAERGLLELDRPIATHWPEYAKNGKQQITIRQVLTHRAGVPHMPLDVTPQRLGDWDWIVAELEQVTPVAEPGTRSIYHSLSFGYLLGEVVRRTDPKRRAFGDFVRQEICEPLGIVDLWIGLPAAEEHRVATLTWGDTGPAPAVASNPLRDLSVPPAITFLPEIWNLPVVHQAGVPAAGGIMSARDGGKFFSVLANGGARGDVRLVSEDRLMALTEPRSNPYEIDEAIGKATWQGIGGYQLGGPSPPADAVIGSSPKILAHGGAGGSIGWADLDSKLAVVITHNRMFGNVSDDEHPFVALANAVRAVAAQD